MCARFKYEIKRKKLSVLVSFWDRLWVSVLEENKEKKIEEGLVFFCFLHPTHVKSSH